MLSLTRAVRVAAVLGALWASAPWASATDFQVPKVTLVVADGNGPVAPGAAVALGELVDVTVTPPDAPVPFLEKTSSEWKVLEGGKEHKFKVAADGNIWYGAGIKPKRQQVFCVATFLYVRRVNQSDPTSGVLEVAVRTQLVYVEVVIGDPAPPPPVVPPAPPAPVVPDGKFKLARLVYDLGQKVPAGDARARGAAALAQAFADSARRVKETDDPAAVLKAATAANRQALTQAGLSPDDWNGFFTALGQALFDMYDKGTLDRATDFAQAFSEISDGLRAIK